MAMNNPSWIFQNVTQPTCPLTQAMARESPAFAQYSCLSLINVTTAVEPPISCFSSSALSKASSMSKKACE